MDLKFTITTTLFAVILMNAFTDVRQEAPEHKNVERNEQNVENVAREILNWKKNMTFQQKGLSAWTHKYFCTSLIFVTILGIYLPFQDEHSLYLFQHQWWTLRPQKWKQIYYLSIAIPLNYDKQSLPLLRNLLDSKYSKSMSFKKSLKSTPIERLLL